MFVYLPIKFLQTFLSFINALLKKEMCAVIRGKTRREKKKEGSSDCSKYTKMGCIKIYFLRAPR